MLTLPNGNFSPKEGKYRNGDVVNFACANNYVRVGPASAQCYYFGWFPSPPLCKGNASVNFIVARNEGKILETSVDSFYKPVLLPRTVKPSLSLKGQKPILFGSL